MHEIAQYTIDSTSNLSITQRLTNKIDYFNVLTEQFTMHCHIMCSVYRTLPIIRRCFSQQLK